MPQKPNEIEKFWVDKTCIHCYNFYMEIISAAFVAAPIGAIALGIGKWVVTIIRNSL